MRRKFDVAEYLETVEDRAAFLNAAFEENDPAYMTRALGIVARADSMSELAEKASLSRPALYRALSETGNPEMATVVRVLDVMGLRLRVEPKAP